VVVGNACLDVTYHLGRLPTPGETLIAERVETDLGGKGLNQAVAARRAGADVRLVAPIGNDAVGKRIKAVLETEGIEDGLFVQSGPSDDSLLLLAPDGENIIISNTSRAQALKPADIGADRFAGADLLLLQGNLSREATLHVMESARHAGLRIALNPSPFQDWFNSLPPVDLIIANQGEADALNVARSTLLVVTLGPKGCRLPSDIVVPAPKVQAVAAAGAGDVFAGTFIAEWLATGDAEQAARLAVLAASDKTTRHGTLSAFPGRSAIDRFRGTMRVPS
jgi:ribokinase